MPAQQPAATRVKDQTLVPLGYAQLTGISTAQALPTIPAGATLAVLQAETQNVRWRDDGTNPTASVGMIIEAGSDIVYTGTLATVKIIEVAATAKVNVAYYR